MQSFPHVPSTDRRAIARVVVISNASRSVEQAVIDDLPDGLVPIARVCAGSVEVSHVEQVWLRGDEVVFLSRLEVDVARGLLDGARAVDRPQTDTGPLPNIA